MNQSKIENIEHFLNSQTAQRAVAVGHDVCLRSMIGIGGASQLRPSHTTVRTGPYTAVREVALTRLEQGWQAERYEVCI